jgi:putative ATP-binding cassette transporter
MVWRERLTQNLLRHWIDSKAYWYLRPGLSPDAVDNPDQRLAEDCRKFVDTLLIEGLELITECVALVSLVAILWGVSDFPLEFTLWGMEFSIDHYLVWLAFVYVALSSVFTHLMGRPLKALIFAQEHREADFRSGLMHLRSAASEVAHAGGEAAERRLLDNRFFAIKGNWRRLIGREFILGLFTRPYFQSVLRVPLFFSLPGYFSGALTFGGLMQVAGAFSRVSTNLSWFIFSYHKLAEFAAVAQRLDDLFASSQAPSPMPDTPRDIARSPSTDGGLHVHQLRLATPDGRWLDAVPDKSILPGSRVWITAPSGFGKTTLLHALSGLWLYGRGMIQLPNTEITFLPQKSHIASAGLAAAVCYPINPDDIAPELLREALRKVGLAHRLDGLETTGEAAVQGLSMGERQRLALARLLVLRPSWIVLDEATSSLDHRAEAELLTLLTRELPQATILCVAHRAPTALGDYDIWRLGATVTVERKLA